MIRFFKEDDRDFFLSTADEFYHTDAVEKPLPTEKLEADFDEIMRSDVYLEGFIIEYGSEKAGYCITAKTFHTEAGGLSVWIEDIYIKKEYRGKGLGTELFDFLHKHYGGRVKRFRLEAEPENEIAVRLYEKQGFRVLPYMQMIKDF